jgi:fatty acid desaturase
MAAAGTLSRNCIKRDYSLVGESARSALESGLASADWYRTPVPRAAMKELMKRIDGPAIRDTVIWLGVMAAAVAGGIWFWPTWECIPFFFVYGTLYGSASDSRWHECGHRTAFKTVWMNDVVYEIASFMLMRNSVTWRWSHTRHHTDTIIVGRDAEIAVMRPPDLARVVLNFVGLVDVPRSLATLVRNAAGSLSDEEKTFIPASEQGKAVTVARVHLAIYGVTLAAAVATWSVLPLMVIGLPRLYGAWHMVLVGLIQHGGLADNVVDFRLNSRTVYMNPISRFLYWNMNYHIEHHMFPLVPFHALPRLHELVKNDCPPANPSIWDAYREMIPAFIRQLRDEDHFVERALPRTARPYRGAPPVVSSGAPG